MIEIKREVYQGNMAAYGELRTIYLDYSQEDFLFWAIYSANKFQDKDAYADVYRIIGNAYTNNSETFSLNAMESVTKNMVIHYLRLAAKSGDIKANSILNDNSIPK